MQHAIDDANEKLAAIIEESDVEDDDLSEDDVSDVYQSEDDDGTEDDENQDELQEVVEKKRFIKH